MSVFFNFIISRLSYHIKEKGEKQSVSLSELHISNHLYLKIQFLRLILVAGKLPCLKLKFQSGTCILMV
jgi:hypothetical protein